MMSQGYGLSEIAQEMSLGDSGTLAQLRSNALPAFLARGPEPAQGITSDDPFSGAAQPAQMAHLAELARKVFAAILADIAAGKQRHQIVASVRVALVAAPSRSKGIFARCFMKSPRLRPPSRP
jgi:hypothetical protein